MFVPPMSLQVWHVEPLTHVSSLVNQTTINVVPGRAVADTCSARGYGLLGAHVGHVSIFHVEFTDAYGNRRSLAPLPHEAEALVAHEAAATAAAASRRRGATLGSFS